MSNKNIDSLAEEISNIDGEGHTVIIKGSYALFKSGYNKIKPNDIDILIRNNGTSLNIRQIEKIILSNFEIINTNLNTRFIKSGNVLIDGEIVQLEGTVEQDVPDKYMTKWNNIYYQTPFGTMWTKIIQLSHFRNTKFGNDSKLKRVSSHFNLVGTEIIDNIGNHINDILEFDTIRMLLQTIIPNDDSSYNFLREKTEGIKFLSKIKGLNNDIKVLLSNLHKKLNSKSIALTNICDDFFVNKDELFLFVKNNKCKIDTGTIKFFDYFHMSNSTSKQINFNFSLTKNISEKDFNLIYYKINKEFVIDIHYYLGLIFSKKIKNITNKE